ncbi:MAG TPA: zinc ABC transporter substrate-binding protein, partial [Rhodospirillales bacterium]|nr:zinc ABC transporter substrate-binding protein [Rhodospirillales bacterium]
AVTVSPERPPGPRRLAEILRRIRREGVVCIFSEPQLRSPLLDRLVADTGVRTATLDPLGVGIDPGPELYFRLLRRNAEAVRACLGG